MNASEGTQVLTLPINLVKPVTLNSKSMVNGFFFSLIEGRPPLIVSSFEDGLRVIYLTNDPPIRFTTLAPPASMSGLLIDSVEIIVEPTSGFTLNNRSAAAGSLLLQDGKVSIVAEEQRGFRDHIPVPLWMSYEVVGAAPDVGFTRWKIITRDGERAFTLWSQSAS